MIRGLVVFAVCLFSAAAHAGDCAKLRPGDSYKELSAILECQDQRIKALEQGPGFTGTSRVGITPSVAADGVWTRGKCFPYERKQPFRLTIILEDSEDPLVLCWNDGTAIVKVSRVKEGDVELTDPSGGYLTGDGAWVNSPGCRYNRQCTLKLSDGRVTFFPQMLVVSGEHRHARLIIESHPL
jgi:hypothetical protein